MGTPANGLRTGQLREDFIAFCVKNSQAPEINVNFAWMKPTTDESQKQQQSPA